MDDTTRFLLLAFEDEEDDDDQLNHFLLDAPSSKLFQRRREEGAYQVLVLRHLVDNDTKFKEYFRLTPYLFDEVLKIIKNDITSTPSKKYPIPISPEEKLCLTLR